MSHDMTEGSISRSLIYFSVPLMLTSLLQQLYLWADALIVGNFIGENALAALGATGAVYGLLLTVISGFSVGISIIIAQSFGRGEKESIATILSLFVDILAWVGAGIALIGFFLVEPLLMLLQTPTDIIHNAALYLRIMLIGIPFMAMYNVYSATLRGVGDSRTPLLAICVSTLANVGLDIFFIVVLGYGVLGAALATIIAQILMTLFTIMYTNRKHETLQRNFLRPRERHKDRELMRQVLKLSIPTATQSFLRSGGHMLLQNVLNSFGSLTVAAVSTAYRIDSIGLLPVIGIASGVTTFTAQNEGAGKPERGLEGLKTGTGISLIISALITVCVYFFGEMLLGLFGISPEAVSIGQGVLIRLALFYPLFGITVVIPGFLQGKGDVVFVSVVNVLSLAVRVVSSYLFAPIWGSMVVAYAEIFSWFFTLIVCGIRFLRCVKPSP